MNVLSVADFEEGEYYWLMRTNYFSSLLLVSLASFSAWGQLRIVDYNTAGGPRAGMATVLQAISEDASRGFSRQIDVLSLQEQTAQSSQAIVDLLNGIHGPGTYDRGIVAGVTSGAGRPGLIYNTQTVSLIDEVAFGTVDTSAQARQTLRYQLRPVGYDSSADFFVYSNHYKASTGSRNQARRQVEAAALRADADALGEGTHAIYSGDFNIRSSSEASYQTLLASGPGQAFDPVDAPGNWNDSSQFKWVHTQAPAVNPSGLVGGGVDDRFDFQLVTGEFLDGEGLDYLSGSYHTFGNNGTHQLNGAISTGTGAAPNVLAALEAVSDHLPVVADYQVPASMYAFLTSFPTTVTLGSLAEVFVGVRNDADVVVPLGADELDYQILVSGNLSGDSSGISLPLDIAQTHAITLNTSTPGPKSGTIIVTTSSQAAANPYYEFNFDYEVMASADFNADGLTNVQDLDMMLAVGPIADGVTTTAGVTELFDLNGDGLIDTMDVTEWLSDAATANGLAAPYLYGDANLDGVVDSSDFNLWNGNKFTPSLAWNSGDFNGDGIVDLSDFNIWNGNKFQSSGGTLVPEPAGLWLAVVALAALFCRRRADVG